jgi:hypothetical protein
VFDSLNLSDSRLKVSIETQSVEGMDLLLADVIKKAPFLVKSEEKKPAGKSVAAPGARSSSDLESPTDAEALNKIQEEGDRIGGDEGAMYILRERRKLREAK